MLSPEACADHYVFWRFEPRDVKFPVNVKGQFQKEGEDRRLVRVDHLGNPARKERRDREPEDVHHPSIHLLLYHLDERIDPPPTPPRVKNQFTDGFEEWVLGPAQFLLVPARKAHSDQPPPTTPPPPRVNHYLCYFVEKARRIDEPMVLRDQFEATDTQGLRPYLFGVPVIKNEEPMVLPEVHLAIYRLEPGLFPPIFHVVNTMDQVQGHKELQCRESVWLGVPSFKEWP